MAEPQPAIIPITTIQENLSQLGKDRNGNYVLKLLKLNGFGIKSIERQLLVHTEFSIPVNEPLSTNPNTVNTIQIASLDTDDKAQDDASNDSEFNEKNLKAVSGEGDENKSADVNTSSFDQTDIGLPLPQDDGTINIERQCKEKEQMKLSFSNIQHLQLQENLLTGFTEIFPKAFHSLSILDLSQNNFTSIQFLDSFPNLVKLNLNDNQLEEFIYKPKFQSLLRHLEISRNQLTRIEIENTKSLSRVNLSKNKLNTVAPLKDCGIRYLDLSDNDISTFLTICHESLQELSLKNNSISTLSSFTTMSNLTSLILSNNKIWNKEEIKKLKPIPCLTELSLIGNPISEDSEYVEFMLYELNQLFKLDGEDIDAIMKVKSKNFFGDDAEMKMKIIEEVFGTSSS